MLDVYALLSEILDDVRQPPGDDRWWHNESTALFTATEAGTALLPARGSAGRSQVSAYFGAYPVTGDDCGLDIRGRGLHPGRERKERLGVRDESWGGRHRVEVRRVDSGWGGGQRSHQRHHLSQPNCSEPDSEADDKNGWSGCHSSTLRYILKY